MSDHLKVGKIEAIKRLEGLIQAGRSFKNAISKEYQVYVERDQWTDLPEGLLKDWAVRFWEWREEVEEKLSEIFVAGNAKFSKFDDYRSAAMSVGPKLNDKYRTLFDKTRDKINILQQILEGAEAVPNQSGNVTVTGSNGVVINTGTINGNIDVNVNQLRSAGATEVAEALKALADAVMADKSGEIDSEAMLKQVEVLSKQATLPAGDRKAGLIGAAWDYIGHFAKIATIANFLESHGDKITAFFGF